MTSPSFEIASHVAVACFSFDYYYLVDASSGKSELEITLSDQTKQNDTLIWSTAGHNLDRWESGEAQIGQSGTFKVNCD